MRTQPTVREKDQHYCAFGKICGRPYVVDAECLDELQAQEVTQKEHSLKMIAKRFKQGMQDCASGIPHNPDMGADYDRGYAARYQHEQQQTAKTGMED